MPARYRPALVDDYCVDRDLAAPTSGDPALTILDRSYGLPAGFVPDDLVPASSAGFDGPSGTTRVSAALIADLTALREAAVAEGLVLEIESGYRSYDDQQATFADWVARIGPEDAAARTARAGHSEHQLGTALDFVSPGWSGRFGDWAVESDEGAWLAARGWEFGFVMSYGAGETDASCYPYEPWHYRWIGRDAAAAHHASGAALREFLAGYADR
jgi:D-alanyl-D-alanine carboxypeptidase